MDFVKKNLGLLICALVCLLLAVFLTVKIFGARKKMQAQVKFLNEQKTFFERAKQENYKLKPEKGQELENIVQAQKNFARVDELYQQGRAFLSREFTFTPAIPLPNSSPEALKQISEQIRSMTDFVIRNDIDFPGIAKEYAQIVQQGSINPAEFKPLFRQLHIYRHLLDNISTAGIKQLRSLDWLMGFQVREEDIYTVTPIYMVFFADLETTQKFLNILSNDPKMLFYVKNVQITAPDRYSRMVQEATKNQGQERTVNPGASEDGMPEEAMMNAPGRQRPPTRPPAHRQTTPEEEGGAGDMRSSGPGQGRLVIPEPRRQDFLVFEEKIAEVVLRVDLYEFQNPEPPPQP
ncbi:MAG: hypothetical protein GX564_08330 [Oligosphaeraceae bacterium]|nr:hypothetical protein [Oligosphaeraceae bacterium]